MGRRISTATAVSEVWDSHQVSDDESDGTSGDLSQARRQSITESETSKQSNQECPLEVHSTKSLKQVTWLQEQNVEDDHADKVNQWNKEQVDIELNKCAALTSEASASSPQAGDQSTRLPETSVAGEVDVNDKSKEDLEDAVKRCTKIAELLNQRLQEQKDTEQTAQKGQVNLPEPPAEVASTEVQDARPEQHADDSHCEAEASRGRPRSLPPRRGEARKPQRRPMSANPLQGPGWLQMEEELSPRALRSLPNQKPLSSWSVEDVYRWTLQVASCPLDVAERLRHQAVNGLVLASLTEQDLENMGVSKFGWRRQLVLLARCLQDKAPTQQVQARQAFQPMAQRSMPPQRFEAPMHFQPGMPQPKHEQGRMLSPTFWHPQPVARSTLPAHFKPLWVGKSQAFTVARGQPQRAVEAPNRFQVLPVYAAS